uniref:Uncharacterized protein n=1 Tax=Knipowitschia caucasica TaxID=637954 RepID=A0AAV2J5I7_KNICA
MRKLKQGNNRNSSLAPSSLSHSIGQQTLNDDESTSAGVAKTLFPRNENSPRAVVKKRTPGKRSPASSLRQGKTAKRLVTKKAAAVSMSLVRDNKDRWMADIEQRLAVRTAELTAERARQSGDSSQQSGDRQPPTRVAGAERDHSERTPRSRFESWLRAAAIDTNQTKHHSLHICQTKA